MSNSLNTSSPEQIKLEDIIKDKILLIFDEENWIKKDLWKIAEVTYSYDESWINSTLFISAWWLDLKTYEKADRKKQEELLLGSRDNLVELLNEKKSQINQAINEVEPFKNSSEDSIESDLKEIFINSLKEKLLLIDYCLNGLPFEIEKAWFDHHLSKQEIKDIEKKQDEIDKKLFWWKIKDDPEEVVLAYEYIYGLYIQNKKNLNEREQKKYEEYLSKIKPYLPEWYTYKQKEKPKRIAWDFLDFEIPRKDYMLWFNITIEALEKLEHVVESSDTAWSISDWPKWVQFPTKNEFDSITIKRFFTLSKHEIETHIISDYNWRQLLWYLRWAWSLEKDEWVAKLMEALFLYWNELFVTDEDWDTIIDINKLEVSPMYIRTLMWEILDNDNYLNFLLLTENIDKDKINPLNRYYRNKRNHKLWVQHKDATYVKWLFKAAKEINKYIKSKWKEWIAPEDLFLWKISFEETPKLKNIQRAQDKALKIENIKKSTLSKVKKTLEETDLTDETKEEEPENGNRILKPLFISDAVYFIITQKLEWKKWNITSWEFHKYLKDKYPIFNFTIKEIENISYKTKRNVYWIVNILLRIISKKQISNITQTNKKAVKKLINMTNTSYLYKIQKTREKMHPDRRKAA